MISQSTFSTPKSIIQELHLSSNIVSFEHLQLLFWNFISTIKLFRKQLMLLKYSLSDKYLKMLLMYWIFGNAVYSIVYNYEVSIYIELNNGSDAWNGSVLSIMLIGGTLGALLPSYLETGQFSNQKKSIYLFFFVFSRMIVSLT